MILNAFYLYLIHPLELLMQWFLEGAYFSTHSYGLAIVVLGVCVNVATLPLYALAERWQREERTIRSSLSPSLQHIKAAFRGQEQLFMVQTLYRQHHYHPVLGLRSSFGLLIQIPIFFAAYHFIGHYQPLDGVSFLWFEDLASPDRLLSLGDVSINAMPFVMTGVNLCSTHVYGRALERRERNQLYLLAAVFLILLYNSPVALVLYWTVSNLFSLGKNLVAQSAAPLPWAGRAGRILGTLTLPVVGLVAVVSTMVAAIALVNARALPASLEVPVTLASFGLALYLALAAAGALIRAFSATSFKLLCAFLVLALAAYALTGIWEVLSSQHYQYALEQERNRIWLGLVLMVLFSLVSLARAPRITLLDFDDPHRVFALSSLLIVTVICIFSPLSLFLSDPTEFPISVGEALAGLVVIGCGSFALLLLTYFVIARQLHGPYAYLMCCLAFIVCIYTFVVVGDFGTIDFFTFDEQAFLTPTRAVIDVVVVAVVCVAIYLALTRGHRQRVSQLLTVLLATTVLVSGYQLYATDIALDEGSAPSHEGLRGLSPLPDYNQHLLNFSRHGQNVVVIMLDAFNAYTLPTSFEREPSLRDGLDGFIWYRNSLAAGYVTALGEPGIHGGHRYTPVEIAKREYDSLPEENARAYRVFGDGFGARGFDVSYAGVQNVRCEKIDEISRIPPVACVGVRYGDDYARSVRWPGKEDTSMLDGATVDGAEVDLRPVLVAASVFRAAPFSLKRAVYGNGRWLGTYPLAQKNRNEAKNAARDLVGLDALSLVSAVSSERSTFKYIQNNATHRPFYIDGDTCLPSLSESHDEVARDCSLRAVIRWLGWLEAQGIYDNTMVVLVSDHGSRRKFGSTLGVPLTRTNALLMVKDFGRRGVLEQSDTFMSNADVPAIVCAAIGGCPGIEPDPRRDTESRTLYFVKGSNGKNYKRISDSNIVYQVKDDIFDTDNWSIVR